MVAFVVLSVGAVLLGRVVDPPLTPLMMLRVLEGAVHGRWVGIDRTRVPLDDVSPALLRAVIASEDAKFFEHNGVDWDAVERARTWNDRHDGRRLRGASTITMQCARSVFLWPGRTWIRKGLEIWFATLMEALWGKRRILEAYVNLVEWGDGIYGAEAAAQAYFGRSVADVDARQAALLAAMLPNPRRWNPAAPTPYLRARASTIARRAAAVRLDPLG